MARKEVRHQLVKAKDVTQEVDVIQEKASADVVGDWHGRRPDDEGVAWNDTAQIEAEPLQVLLVELQ